MNANLCPASRARYNLTARKRHSHLAAPCVAAAYEEDTKHASPSNLITIGNLAGWGKRAYRSGPSDPVGVVSSTRPGLAWSEPTDSMRTTLGTLKNCTERSH